jgi:hypothetical protein
MTMQDAPTNRPARTTAEPARPRRSRRLALGLGAIALAIGLVAPASTFAASPTVAATDGSTTAACTGGAWPWSVQGAPSFAAGSAAGVRLWHGPTGWHLRVTHPGTYLAGFSGTIHANTPLHVTGYRLEAEDGFTVSADGMSVSYRFKNHGGLDGLDFTTECATRLGVSARMNGALLPARRIWIGHAGRHPLGNPFAILRRA